MNIIKVFQKIVFLLCCLPAALLAQDASNMIPKQSAVKDTSRQTDLIDIAKDLFQINPKKPRYSGKRRSIFLSCPFPEPYRVAPGVR
jgi:hypothetical protein